MAPIVILISANAEWQAVRELFPWAELQASPFGEWFPAPATRPGGEPLIYFQGGWGKIAAAASTQYAIDRWKPALLVNLGTCGGIEGHIAPGTIILAERTLVYDIIEQMGDPQEAIDHYATRLDLSWLGGDLPAGVLPALLLSADRDLVAGELPELRERYGAVAADWESGAIAWTASRSGVRCLILRAVSDLAGASGDETYGRMDLFVASTRPVMRRLVEMLPACLDRPGLT